MRRVSSMHWSGVQGLDRSMASQVTEINALFCGEELNFLRIQQATEMDRVPVLWHHYEKIESFEVEQVREDFAFVCCVLGASTGLQEEALAAFVEASISPVIVAVIDADPALCASILSSGVTDILRMGQLQEGELASCLRSLLMWDEDKQTHVVREPIASLDSGWNTTLVRGVAHQMNNLLTPVIGQLSLAAEELPPDHIARRDIQDVLGWIDRSQTALDALWMMAPRQEELHLAPISLSRWMTQWLLERRPFWEVELEVHTNFATLLEGVVDPYRLGQVLDLLVQNSREAIQTRDDMSEPGRLSFSLRRTTGVVYRRALLSMFASIKEPRTLYQDLLDQAVSQDAVLITIEDNGSGIAKHIQDKIFMPFYTTKQSEQKRGVGLSIVYSQLKHMQGAISLDSQVGRGTRTEIYLPLLL